MKMYRHIAMFRDLGTNNVPFSVDGRFRVCTSDIGFKRFVI